MTMESHREPEAEPGRADPGEARERKAGVLGFVAHEVRNPLSTALWTAELLARMSPEDRGGARGEKLTAMSLRALARVRQTIEDHFLMERLDVGGLPVRIEDVDLGEVVRSGAAKVTGASVEVELDGTLVAQADPALLERAVESLVAITSADGAAVRVVGKAEGDEVILRFRGAPPGPDALHDPRKGSPSDARGRALAGPVARRVAATLHGRLEAEPDAWVLSLPGGAAYPPASR